ncbi:MAG TPA: PTS sugar transporter subunit IIA [Chlamydiales bacterium]|nr:PTS sugar transporter subunit IIA [Chlamydiales bacterium]
MDLELKEVSELLNVPAEELSQWAEKGTIPSYCIQNRLRFNREEIEEWLLENPDAAKRNDKLSFDLFRALSKGEVFNLAKASSKEEAIKEAMKQLAPKLELDPEVLTEVILAREELMPTSIGAGFAIPHARDFHLPGPHDVVSVVFLPKPIAYGALDNIPVHTLFFLFATDDRRHLRLLAKIAHLISNPNVQHSFASHPNKTALLELVKTWETELGIVKN